MSRGVSQTRFLDFGEDASSRNDTTGRLDSPQPPVYNPKVNRAWRLPIRLTVTILLVAIGILIILLPYIVKRQRVPALLTPTIFTDSAAVPAGTLPPDSANVAATLRTVIDPEVGISIVDLGLVDSLRIDSSGNVNIAIALTTPECPVVGQLGRQTANVVIEVPGVRKVRVRLDPSLPWAPSRLSPEARELYRKRFGYLPRQNDEARDSNPGSSSNAGE